MVKEFLGLPEDLARRRFGVAHPRPSPIMPSDIELLVKEIQYLKAEIAKIKEALKKHGIKVD